MRFREEGKSDEREKIKEKRGCRKRWSDRREANEPDLYAECSVGV